MAKCNQVTHLPFKGLTLRLSGSRKTDLCTEMTCDMKFLSFLQNKLVTVVYRLQQPAHDWTRLKIF